MLSGAFWINKPVELTSSDVVVRLKIALTRGGYCERGFKIGHGGTLDPFATGALVVLVGEATKLADAYLHSTKSYRGVISLGTRTDTGDFTGQVVETAAPGNAMFQLRRGHGASTDSTDWQKLADQFVKDEYWQTPPMYSAKKVDGRTLHSMAREGIEVERKAILKKIYEFTVNPLPTSEVRNGADDFLSFQIRCESGTYVRVIAEDLAKKAGTVAHLSELIRTATSDVTLEKCSSLDEVLNQLTEKCPIEKIRAFHSLKNVATHLPSIAVTPADAEELLQGQSRTVHSMIHRFEKLFTLSPKYFVARLDSGEPVALFERTSEVGSLLPPTYRLQRVILWQH